MARALAWTLLASGRIMGDVVYISDYLERKRERAWLRYEYEGGDPPNFFAGAFPNGFSIAWDELTPCDPVRDIMAFQAHIAGPRVTSVHYDELDLDDDFEHFTLPEGYVFHSFSIYDKEPPEGGPKSA